jgi:hypothetical protein
MTLRTVHRDQLSHVGRLNCFQGFSQLSPAVLSIRTSNKVNHVFNTIYSVYFSMPNIPAVRLNNSISNRFSC